MPKKNKKLNGYMAFVLDLKAYFLVDLSTAMAIASEYWPKPSMFKTVYNLSVEEHQTNRGDEPWPIDTSRIDDMGPCVLYMRRRITEIQKMRPTLVSKRTSEDSSVSFSFSFDLD